MMVITIGSKTYRVKVTDQNRLSRAAVRNPDWRVMLNDRDKGGHWEEIGYVYQKASREWVWGMADEKTSPWGRILDNRRECVQAIVYKYADRDRPQGTP